MDKELVKKEVENMRGFIQNLLRSLGLIQEELDKPEPPVVVPPIPPVTTIRQPKGFYVMQEVGGQNVNDAKLKSARHQGILIRESWARLNPSKGQYNFSFLDNQISRCQSFNKQFILSIYTGSNAPVWIPGSKFGPSGKLAPLPWNVDMLNAYAEMMGALANRYGDNKLLVGVEIGGPTCPDMSIEMHFTSNVQSQKGYSEQAMIDAWKKCGRAVADAFNNVAVITDGGPAPGGGKETINNAFYDYMFKTYPNQFNVSHCALSAGTNEDWIGHTLVSGHKKKGGRIGFEAVGPSVTRKGEPLARFKGTFSESLEIGKRAGMSWYKYYQDDEQFLPLDFGWA
jgi:hypothetical protein